MKHGRVLAKLLRKNLPSRIRGAEVGVFRGKTSAYLLQKLPELQLLMIDSWQAHAPDSLYFRSRDKCARQTSEQQHRNRLLAINATEPFAARRRIIHLASDQAIHDIEDGSLDFIFIDADHTYEAVRYDIAAWSKKLRPSGILAGHDYGVRGQRSRRSWGVKKAVDDFCNKKSLTLQLENFSVWWTIVPTSSCISRAGPKCM